MNDKKTDFIIGHFFEVSAVVCQEGGKEEKTRLAVEASSFGEAERAVLAIHGLMEAREIREMRRARYQDVIGIGLDDADALYFQARVALSEDGDIPSRRRRIYRYYLVKALTMDEAIRAVKAYLADIPTMTVDFINVQETKISVII